MPPINRIAEFSDDMKTWRRWLHQHPELGFELHETAAFVADRLREIGVDELHEGIATTGMVAIIQGQGAGQTIGLRADMDALPIFEETGLDYASAKPGVMHACGHDGHTTMLLGAAKYLAETRRFRGRVALIFQPAEEEGGGGGVMCDEGIFKRFDISQVYGIHNIPNLDAGQMQLCAGPMLAAVDDFDITITGRGGHAAHPDTCIDPIPPAVALVQGLQSVVARNADPLHGLVLSVTQIQAGSTTNVIPETALVAGTIRTYDSQMRAMAAQRLRALCDGVAQAYSVEIAIDFREGYPATVNDETCTDFARAVALDVAGTVTEATPSMGAEDFSFMLERCPGTYAYLGTGAGAALHHPAYDFNDEVAHIGASYFARLVERAQPI
ncbi:hippurate hydrolase HipO [Actibacterium atlanticum]|uniref:Hippurate hydrolase HipO n=1 Tax=Actibacterium atlanticum TaxID=1461693 RepID=A0A058ZRN2_9RHOB|nr:M20 aminoacylase family protein [Actibacterium atlanticum]KCV83526.1 hippurate hydrolase HipO [Actibacterium atlanticum]